MLEILSEIVKKIIDSIWEFISQQLYYVFCYKNNLKKLKDHVEDLEGQRYRIQYLVNAEKRNGKTIFPDVLKWLEEVEKITGEAEQLQGNADHVSVGCCPNLLSQHQFGCRAEAEAKNVGDWKLKGEKFTSVAYDPPSEPGFAAYIRGVKMFESRMSIMNEILQAVTVPNICMVGVYGLGGVGKTTLMHQVAKKAKFDNSFDAVVMATVTKTPDFRLIQGEIADELGLKLEKETLSGRASRLRYRIEQEKTILVILDDIWENFDLNKVGIPLGDHKGCKMLMTSRTQEVLNKMGSQKDFRLEPLDESETWMLFQVMAGDDVVKDRKLQGIASQVANKCAGLPVLIVTVSTALRGKGLHAWKDASNRLTAVDNEDLQEIYRSALELSYNGLEGNDMKELFLLCGVHGPHVYFRDLLIYGMGLGIFKNVNTVEDARNRLHSMIDRLKASCLLLEDDKMTQIFRMHDNVREVAVSIASRDERFLTTQGGSELIEWPTESYTQIILKRCGMHELPKKLENHELRILCLGDPINHEMEIPDSFFEGVTNLEVLDLTLMKVSSLPISMSSLIKLKTLCLDYCALGGMAALRTLKNVEILSLIGSSITILPTEIGQLTRLRILDLRSSRIELIPPNIISRLINLEEFDAGDTSIKWEAENTTKQNKNASVAELSQLSRLTALNIQIQDASILPQDDLFFEKLERYKIFIGDVWTWFEIYEDWNILKLKLSNSTHIGQGMRKLLEGVEELHLNEIKGCGNIKYLFLSSMIQSFSNLKLLEISNCHEMEEIVAAKEGRNNGINLAEVRFPKLEKMIIHDMKNLKTIWHQQFASLRTLEVKNCEKLVRFFPSHMQRKFSNLETIKVTKCSSLEEIFELNATENEKESEVNTQLRNLTLVDLPNLKQIWREEAQGIICFHNLEGVHIEECPKLEYLFPLSIAMNLPQLEKICIEGALSMNEFVAKTERYMEGTVKFEFNRLTTFIIENLLEADRFYAGNFTLHCPSLKILEVIKCPKLELFKMQSTSYQEREHDGCLDVSSEQSIFFAEEVITKLEVLCLSPKEVRMIQQAQFQSDLYGKLKVLRLLYFEDEDAIFPYWILQRLPNLRTLWIQHCSFNKILQEGEKEPIEIGTRIKQFQLIEVHEIQQICQEGSQLDPVLEVVETIDIERCSGLIYLVPYYVSFSHLTHLRIVKCNGLLYLISSSTARSLIQLRHLHMWECESLEEIVKEREDEMEQNIAFNNLTFLDLKCLPSLNWFSSSKCLLCFPMLSEVVVEQCPKMKTFSVGDTSTPGLRHAPLWEGNLNATINKMST